MKKLFVLLLVVAIGVSAFMAGIVIGPKLGSTEYEIGEVEVGEMVTGTEAAEIYHQNHNGK